MSKDSLPLFDRPVAEPPPPVAEKPKVPLFAPAHYVVKPIEGSVYVGMDGKYAHYRTPGGGDCYVLSHEKDGT